MKIRVITSKYEYQGLYKGSEHTVDEEEFVTGVMQFLYHFTANGKPWKLFEEECEEIDDVEIYTSNTTNQLPKGPIKSDGGSSTYYDIYLPEWLIKRMVEREVDGDGKAYIKTEEIIECFFESDFDFSNAFKSLVRAYGAFNGGGKAGNDVSYEVKKIQYSCDKIKDRFERKEKK